MAFTVTQSRPVASGASVSARPRQSSRVLAVATPPPPKNPATTSRPKIACPVVSAGWGRDVLAYVDAPTAPADLRQSLEDMIAPSEVEGPAAVKPRIVILGSGWGAMSIMKSLNKNVAKQYDITVVSPRNYFLYTPLLPAVASGTCEMRSIVEPVRKLVHGKANFLEAECEEIDAENKRVVASFPEGSRFAGDSFEVPYDILVVTVGSSVNTFNTPGVQEHCLFMKSIEDAKKLRKQISEHFERAALPDTSDEEKARLLSFVVVGGGPTGVEVAAEMHDLLEEDMKRLYPRLMHFCKIRMVVSDDHMLSTYDRAISEFTLKQFNKLGIETILHHYATGVTPNTVQLLDASNKEATEMPYGICVWATGIKMNPLVEKIKRSLPSDIQKHSRCLMTDAYMRVKGSDGSIYCLGDAGTITQEEAHAHAAELFKEGDTNGDGVLQLSELRELLLVASKQYPQLSEYATFLDGKAGSLRLQTLLARAMGTHKTDSKMVELLGNLDRNSELSLDEFERLLAKIDSSLRALPATAQVASQQGAFFAQLLGKTRLTPEAELEEERKFEYTHKGSLAYIGEDKAVLDAPFLGSLFGSGVGFIWKGFETVGQFSMRNRVLVAADWTRAKLLGRDISDL